MLKTNDTLLKRAHRFVLDVPFNYAVKRVRQMMMEEPLSNLAQKPLVQSTCSVVATQVYDAYEVASQIQTSLTTSLVRPVMIGLENTLKSVVDSVSGLDVSVVIPNKEALLLVGAAAFAGTGLVMHVAHRVYDRCNKEESAGTPVNQSENESNVDQNDERSDSMPVENEYESNVNQDDKISSSMLVEDPQERSEKRIQEVESNIDTCSLPSSSAMSKQPLNGTNTTIGETVSTQLLVDSSVSTPASFSPSSDYATDNLATEEESSPDEVEVVCCYIDKDYTEAEKSAQGGLCSRSAPVECISLVD